jgi:ABC-type phosphate transport system permease subunit
MNIPGGTNMAAATAVLLFVLLMLINASARAIASKYSSRMLMER